MGHSFPLAQEGLVLNLYDYFDQAYLTNFKEKTDAKPISNPLNAQLNVPIGGSMHQMYQQLAFGYG